jgi:uncharacterized protein (DUF433 family)
MLTVNSTNTLITRLPQIVNGRPIIAGTGTSVRRIASLYKQGMTPEEIAGDLECVTLVQVYAALTYYHANREEIEADLKAEAEEYLHLAQIHLKAREF